MKRACKPTHKVLDATATEIHTGTLVECEAFCTRDGFHYNKLQAHDVSRWYHERLPKCYRYIMSIDE